jgi:hypothetical protein
VRYVANRSVFVGVSFARVPLREISSKIGQLEARGWREDRRGDPWTVFFVKDSGEQDAAAAEEEIREVMGNYWVDAAAMQALLGR